MDLLHISQNIRKIRQLQKMTLDQLAAKCEVSKGFISQVENFRLTPSLKTLNRIAAALGVDMAQLFQQDQTVPEFSLDSLSGGERIQRDDGEDFGIIYHALAYRQIGREMDPFLIEYRPAEHEREFKMHDAEEFFLLLEGELDFFLFNDERVLHLKAGDTLYLKANIPHKVHLVSGCKGARALSVFTRK